METCKHILVTMVFNATMASSESCFHLLAVYLTQKLRSITISAYRSITHVCRRMRNSARKLVYVEDTFSISYMA